MKKWQWEVIDMVWQGGLVDKRTNILQPVHANKKLKPKGPQDC